MADKIEAEVQGTGTRVITLHGHASLAGNEVVRRALALDLSILSFAKMFPDTKDIVERAREFERFIKGDGKA